MSAPYSVIDVANYFIKKGRKDDMRDLTPIKLQKLVFFAHGWYLGYNGKPLFNEKVEAWPWGPVVPELYHRLKDYGNRTIFDLIYPQNTPNIASDDADLLDDVWKAYGKYDGFQLSTKTHEKGSPWEQVYDDCKRSQEIPNELIQNFYKAQITTE